jgi:hypothetical protein
MSEVKTDKLSPRTGSGTVTLGTSGDTFSIPSGVTIANSGTVSGFGKVLQVVSATKTDVFSASPASLPTTVDVTGLSVNITPSSTSNKVLVFYNVYTSSASGVTISISTILDRSGTDIAIGDAVSNHSRVTTYGGSLQATDGGAVSIHTMNYLDSPASTSALTYKIKLGGFNSTTVYVNRTGRDNDLASYDGRFVSTITAMEIAG